MSRNITCPKCKKITVWSTDNEFRPFCSGPCKMQDLGAWFLEEHTIQGEKNTTRSGIDISDLPADMQAEIKDLLN